jgi:hypothetical protein
MTVLAMRIVPVADGSARRNANQPRISVSVTEVSKKRRRRLR